MRSSLKRKARKAKKPRSTSNSIPQSKRPRLEKGSQEWSPQDIDSTAETEPLDLSEVARDDAEATLDWFGSAGDDFAVDGNAS